MEPATRAELQRLGKAIRAACREMRLSQEDFAERAEIHRTYIGCIERGQVNVSWQNISRVAHALRLRPSELIARASL
jgi:transcriptional regulator with XRE-family HTH domain